ncbi:unnamed protein product, partial [Gongylonema pulchrum]|uniref:WH2 domain-containing protein n=1 Tax=Gongylonema pulchrum TaxID=637853 RepID=A0A183EJ38_9BILA
MPPTRPPPPKDKSGKKPAAVAAVQELSSLSSKKDDKMHDAMDKFADELNRSSDDEEEDVIQAGDQQFVNGGATNELSEVEKDLIREELRKTEEEINTLRQVLVARQK